MPEMRELTTETEALHLSNDPQPPGLFIRWRGRLWLRTPVRWLSPWVLLALALVGGAGVVAVVRLLGPAR